MDTDENADAGFLGRGWTFPVTTDRYGRVSLSEREADIEDSIRIVLGTAKGERVMRPTFGCGIHDYVFETVDTTTLSRLEGDVRDALIEWEPRIEVTNVDASTEQLGEGTLLVRIDYRVRSTNTEFNLVYPFYLLEGRGGE
jgi:hypothetical protein